MRVTRQISSWILTASLFLGFATLAVGQGSYRAQLRGVVADASGAVVVNARVTITDVGTNISSSTNTDEKGEYHFTGLRPSTYTVKVESTGFRPAERTGVVLAVDQESSLNFTLGMAGVSTTVEVTTTAPLMDTENATLGTDITSEYVKELPLLNRDFFGLTFLAGGVTETAGSGAMDNYPTGTNFVSNGQRNATAEIRIDGSLISAPEQGEGGNSNVYYEPLVEGVQEFKVQNNLFSAEFGNNGGTVVNMVLKSGTNAFHGSAWYFFQRSDLAARDFFNPAPFPKPNSQRDQGGFSLGGPIRKNKTFFFGDFEKVANTSAFNNVATVPTMEMRALDPNFSNTGTNIYDPKRYNPTCQPTCRPQVPGNIIPHNEVDPLGRAILNLYPQPNLPGYFNNFLLSGTAEAPDYQFDIKVDNQINDKQRISGRYSRGVSGYSTPMILGDGFTNNGTGDGIAADNVTAQNGSIEWAWTINPRMVWTNHFAIDRVSENENTNIPTIQSFNQKQAAAGLPQLPSLLMQANGVDRMPEIIMSGEALAANAPGDLYDQCCVNTTFAHTLYSYSSQMVWSKGSHLIKFGGEQRLFYNNFFQPPGPTGVYSFTDFVTSPSPNSETDAAGNVAGNPFASLLFGYADNINPSNATPSLFVMPSVANKSKETGFYIQDDWKVNRKLTLNLGVRYEWSTPYNERYNRIQFSDFTGQTGYTLDLSSAQAALAGIGVGFPSSEKLPGTTEFPTSSMRSVPTYYGDIGPRFGFAYGIDSKTVVRGGAGIYFGMSPATNFQYPGAAFSKNATMLFTTDNFQTQYATLSNPFPANGGLPPQPQGKQYGPYAVWGYSNGNDLGTTAARDADIYQWNLGIQRELPSQIVIGIDYVANRSTHLPWAGTNNRDFISSSLLSKISTNLHRQYDAANGSGACDANGCVSSFLSNTVNNPFFSLFTTPCTPQPPAPCFNAPDSVYTSPQIALGYLLNPYPQFTGDFEGLMIEEASSWYNAMQIRFQKRATHHVSFEGSYTVSKFTDDSSAGRNNWVGSLGAGIPQQLDRLDLEHSISANDTPQRLAAAVVVDLPVGRNEAIGGNMNRVLDAVVGGWSVNAMVSEQSGQPINIFDDAGALANGTQRPNVICSNLKTGISMKEVAESWSSDNPLSFFNSNCFAHPGDQIPGNAPRYFPGLRVNGVHNIDANFSKSFVPKEGTRIELRAEMFNLFNHPRFASPDTAFEGQGFGTITSSAAGYLPRYFQFGVRFEF
ncbi:MAG TPA: carboxypeptidase regulatory-like domain-containing protein [Terriglobales bacterium]|nr:carboxypeptidase regulatory-like domain-containing protein [Terriglobales bacterium]